MRKKRHNFNSPPPATTEKCSAIAELPLSVRTINQIEKQAGFVYLSQIINLTRDQLKEMLPDNGDRVVDELAKALQKIGMEVPETWIRIKKRVRGKT